MTEKKTPWYQILNASIADTTGGGQTEAYYSTIALLLVRQESTEAQRTETEKSPSCDFYKKITVA